MAATGDQDERDTAPLGPAVVAPIALAVALLVVEAASHLGAGQLVIGGIPSTALAAVAGAALTWRTWRRDALAQPGTWIVLAALVPAVAVAVAHTGVAPVLGLVPVAFGEEAVFRVALPLVVLAVLARTRTVLPTWAPAVAVAVAAVVFTVMPGHVAQWSSSPTGPLPWVALAVLWSGMLWRGLPLLAAVAHHAVVDLAALAVHHGAPAQVWHLFLVTPVLAAFGLEALSSHRAARRVTAA